MSSSSSTSRQNNNNNNRVARHVRDRQRAVAEREASRLARPERRPTKKLGHADRKKSAVTSTPFGVLPKPQKGETSTADSASWCGPFAVAREMIAERERRLREEQEEEGVEASSHPLDEIMKQLEHEKKRKAHPSLQWKGKPITTNTTDSNIYAKRQKRVVQSASTKFPSLFDICVKFLVDNFDCVERLGEGVDGTIRSSITAALVAAGKMNATHFVALTRDEDIEALEIVDCAQISQDQMVEALRKLIGGLRYLILDQAGRCVGPKTVNVLATKSNRLFALSIGGAYLLTDTDSARLIEAVASTVASLDFKACPLLGDSFCQSIGTTCERLVELALEDIPLSQEQLKLLVGKGTTLGNLKNLSLRRLTELNDDILSKCLEITSSNLEGLDLTGSFNLTDTSLAWIRKYSINLKGLILTGLRHLTSEGLEALFTVVHNMDDPPQLRTLDLGQLDYEAVNDTVVSLAAQAATKKQASVSDQTDRFGGLVRVNIQGSTLVTDVAMESLAASCTATLQELNVSFCPHVSNKGLGYLVDHLSQLNTIHVWGCAQLTDEFFDGNSRANDASLEICGAWIKKHASSVVYRNP